MIAIATQSNFWHWQGCRIRYQCSGATGPALILIHGFGASSAHWRKNLPDLGQAHRVFAIDLLGFGQSDKPTPNLPFSYTFETWGQLVADFCREVVGEAAVLVGNSIGCVVALQAAVDAPEHCRGVVMIDCSLRLLHVRKRATLPWYRSAGAPILQAVLDFRPLGQFFFSRLATARSLNRILKQAYGRKDSVTDELVELLLEPAFDPGALDVFLAFIKYDDGPLAEDLLPQIRCPVLILWGEVDPWEPIELARQEYADLPMVDRFVPLPGLGHCPQDEAPEIVDPLITEWVASLGSSQ